MSVRELDRLIENGEIVGYDDSGDCIVVFTFMDESKLRKKIRGLGKKVKVIRLRAIPRIL